MDLGGGGFRIKGILADSMQISEYLQGPPKWWVRAVLETESAAGEAWLMLRDPACFGGVSSGRARIDKALDWPVDFKILVGTSAVPALELRRIDSLLCSLPTCSGVISLGKTTVSRSGSTGNSPRISRV